MSDKPSRAAKFVICCPGPSLNTSEVQENLLSEEWDYLIAVNGAFKLDIKWFDFWILQDMEVFSSVAKGFSKQDSEKMTRCTLLVPDRWLQELPLLYPEITRLFELMNKEVFPGRAVEQYAATMPIGKNINWREYTLFAAIAEAIKRDAGVIKIYGADWSGQGYFVPGLENGRMQHSTRRWMDEIDKFHTIKDEAERCGIKIIREIKF